jgi:zinc protease
MYFCRCNLKGLKPKRRKMQKIDRRNGPGIRKLENIVIPEAKRLQLNNGLQMILLESGTQDVIKLDMIIKGGRLAECKNSTARFCASLLREGAAGKNAEYIAEYFDYYGATFRIGSNLDYSYVSLTCMSRYLAELLPLFAAVIFQPDFPEDELEKFKSLQKQKLLLDLAKDELVSYRLITESIFGANHPYGYNSEQHFIDAIQLDDLKEYHNGFYCPDNMYLVVSGRVSTEAMKLIDLYLGIPGGESRPYSYPPCTIPIAKKKITRDSPGEYQFSIKIGRRMFHRNHPDYPGFYLLNTILGGYFGSRLMTSIREELGYTYNIYSVIDHLVHDGYFYIGTETAHQYIKDVYQEIFRQIDLLKTYPVPADELDMSKSYLMGSFLNLIDGPFNLGSFHRSNELDGYSLEKFYAFANEIRHTSAERLQELANQYLNEDSFTEVIVGKVDQLF